MRVESEGSLRSDLCCCVFSRNVCALPLPTSVILSGAGGKIAKDDKQNVTATATRFIFILIFVFIFIFIFVFIFIFIFILACLGCFGLFWVVLKNLHIKPYYIPKIFYVRRIDKKVQMEYTVQKKAMALRGIPVVPLFLSI